MCEVCVTDRCTVGGGGGVGDLVDRLVPRRGGGEIPPDPVKKSHQRNFLRGDGDLRRDPCHYPALQDEHAKGLRRHDAR